MPFLSSSSEAGSSYVRLRSITDKLTAPSAVAVDAFDNAYVAEAGTNTVFIFDSTGRCVRRITGFDKPVSIAVDQKGRLLVGNAGPGSVEVYENPMASRQQSGSLQISAKELRLLFKAGTGDGEFLAPSSIAVDGTGKIYVADLKESVVKIFGATGSYSGTLGATGQFTAPTSVTIQKQTGKIFVCDSPVQQFRDGTTSTARVQVFDGTGVLKGTVGEYGQGEGLLTKAMGVAVDGTGNIYVTDSYQNVVQMFSGSGASLGALYTMDNPFRTPMGIAVSDSNTLYVASHRTGTVEVYRVGLSKTAANTYATTEGARGY